MSMREIAMLMVWQGERAPESVVPEAFYEVEIVIEAILQWSHNLHVVLLNITHVQATVLNLCAALPDSQALVRWRRQQHVPVQWHTSMLSLL